MDIEQTLKQRGDRYGPFTGHATVTQNLKSEIKTPEFFERMDIAVLEGLCTHEEMMAILEAIDMICHKLGRIANGDPLYDDSWRDIEGYARLITKMLENK